MLKPVELEIEFFCRGMRINPSCHTGEDGRRTALESRQLAPAVRDAFIELLIASNSALVIVPVGDVFGWADRINTPATVNDRNWTWRMPWPNERLAFEPEAIAAVKRLREWCRRWSRS